MSEDSEHIQLVWDRGRVGTAQAACGCSITVGPGGEWTPEQLLIVAAESSIMTVFLRLAEEERLGVLGYVSAAGATLLADPHGRPRIVVRPCIVVGGEEDKEVARRILARAAENSPVAHALADSLQIDAEVVVLGSLEAN